MSSVWRVNLHSKLWNQNKFEEQFMMGNTRLAQSKGKATMKIVPKKGEKVVLVSKGKIIMQGIIENDGFLEGTDHQNDTSNIGTKRSHAEQTYFTWINIQQIGMNDPIRLTGQRTWAKILL
jgi:hypothetical protein